jgi:hypothetical protein
MIRKLYKKQASGEGVLGRYIEESRRHLVGLFFTPETQALAGQAFDEYVSAGGIFRAEDMRRLQDIVNKNFRTEKDITRQICGTIEEVRTMIAEDFTGKRIKGIIRLPARGPASTDPGDLFTEGETEDKTVASSAEEDAPISGVDEPQSGVNVKLSKDTDQAIVREFANEARILQAFATSLRPARLPSALSMVPSSGVGNIKNIITDAILRATGSKQ